MGIYEFDHHAPIGSGRLGAVTVPVPIVVTIFGGVGEDPMGVEVVSEF